MTSVSFARIFDWPLSMLEVCSIALLAYGLCTPMTMTGLAPVFCSVRYTAAVSPPGVWRM